MDLQAVLEAAANGDRQAWNALVAQYNGLVWSVARAHRLGDADAADVVQTTWLRLVEQLDRIRNPEGVGAWLATTARRECLRVLRVGQRQVLTDERDATLWQAFAQLGERCRTLLRVLTADPPPSYDEVGAALDMPIGSIGPTRARCLEQLRRKLAVAGMTAAPDDA